MVWRREHDFLKWQKRASKHLAAQLGFRISEFTDDGWLWFVRNGDTLGAIPMRIFVFQFWKYKDGAMAQTVADQRLDDLISKTNALSKGE